MAPEVRSSGARPDMVFAPPSASTQRRHRHVAGSWIVVPLALLVVVVAAWILVAVVFSVLHVIELIAVAAGAGWIGYRIGHFKGSRDPHAGD